jgi:hypothetical protein
MIKKLFIYLGIIGIGALGLQSCYNDNEEYLYPQTAPCDTVNVTYAGIIAPLLSNQCNACHSGSSPSAGISTDNYSDLKIIVDNGRFWGSVSHADGFSKMPKDRPKLSDCDLLKINSWIANGALNN